MNFRKLLFLFIILFTTTYLVAQKPVPKNTPTFDEQPIHFGFALGFNAMDFNFKRHYTPNPTNSIEQADSLFADISKLAPGFQINIITDFRITESFHIRILPGIIFGQRDISYFNRSGKVVNTQTTESNLIDIPLLFKYRAKRVNNYAPYVIGGAAARYDLQSRTNYEGDKLYILFKPIDVYGEFGAGIDFYLPFFKLSTELKMSLGMLDVLNHTPKVSQEAYVKSIDKLHSNILFLSFYFE